MTTLVTGGAGFIGTHLVQRMLERESAVRILCVDNFNDYYDPAIKRENAALFLNDARVSVIEQSFCDLAGMERLLSAYHVRRIVHLGAYAGVRASVDQPSVFVENNVGGTLAVLEAARRVQVERVVYISSSTVYGAGAKAPFREDAVLGVPTSPYGVTKRAGELMCLCYWQLHQLPVVCVRPFSVYGPRIRPDLAMSIFTESILRSRPVPLLGDGRQRRDFTHVSDICDGLLASMEAVDVVGEVINLGNHEPVATIELVAMLEKELGARQHLISVRHMWRTCQSRARSWVKRAVCSNMNPKSRCTMACASSSPGSKSRATSDMVYEE